MVNPPIVPPVNNTCEPVICPLSDNIRLLLELDIVFSVIPNPSNKTSAFNTLLVLNYY